MSFDIDKFAASVESKWNGCVNNAKAAVRTTDGFLHVVGRTTAAALGAGLFVSIIGAGFLGTLAIMAMVGLAMFCYTSSHYHEGQNALNTMKEIASDPNQTSYQVNGWADGIVDKIFD